MRIVIYILGLSFSLIATNVLGSPALKLPDAVIPITRNKDHSHVSSDLSTAPMPPNSDSWKDPDSLIFVGIASYRDQRCATTLANLFTKAQYPDRLRIGQYPQQCGIFIYQKATIADFVHI
ncbi:hypothetical protein EON65_26500 [archaeon]|nr:MAG: hypothetical protein EON65_26500 [archaeon]